MGRSKTCNVADCGAVHLAKGLCSRHYYLNKRRTSPALVKKWDDTARARKSAEMVRLREKEMGRRKPPACEACEDPCNAVWDHDHATGAGRGWLCGQCNLALGNLKDDPERINKLRDYAEKYCARSAS